MNINRIIHILPYQPFIGGGERLIFSWKKHSRFPSLFFAYKEKLVEYDEEISFYRNYNEMAGIVRAYNHNSYVIWHNYPMRKDVYAKIRTLNYNNIIGYVHGAASFGVDLELIKKPRLVLSNYMPEDTHPSWDDIQIKSQCLGIDTNIYVPSMKQTTGRIVVGIIGRVSPEKVPDQFFDSLEAFNEFFPRNNFIFLHYGAHVKENEFSEHFFRRVARIPNYKYMGHVPFNKVPRLYDRFDVLLVPSLTETGSYAIAEAQSSGLQVFALRCDGIPSHVLDQSLLGNTYNQLLSKLNQFANTKEKCHSQIDNTRRHAVQKFNIKAWANRLDDLVSGKSL